MASGKFHDRAIRLGSYSIFLGSIVVFGLSGAEALTIALSNEIGGQYLSPDLDLLQSNPTKRWRRLRLAWVWVFYRRLSHRSFLSHCPVVGTLGRVIYLLFPLLIAEAVTRFVFDGNEGSPWLAEIIAARSHLFSLILIGLFLSEINHLFFDFVYNPSKRHG